MHRAEPAPRSGGGRRQGRHVGVEIGQHPLDEGSSQRSLRVTVGAAPELTEPPGFVDGDLLALVGGHDPIEVGGAIDRGSEAHDLVMMLFGGMSKGERMRIKTRVRTAMSAQAATQGRFLGGRPPYGYRLTDAGPHPNPEKAGDGKRLHRLEPDPETAPVVQRIFDEYLAGRGYLAIAERLTADGISSPSGPDPARNRQRHGLAWGKSAVRAILCNPRYTGYQVWAKQRREEVLLDVEDVSAGHPTVMRWNAEEQWVWSTAPSHEAPISMETFREVQSRMVVARRGNKPRRGPRTERPYLLRGRLRCGLCGRKLQGSWHHGEAYYRCQYGAEYARSARLPHPKVVYLRGWDLLPHVDDWLGRLFDPENVDATCEAILGAATERASPAERAAASDLLRECDQKLDRYRELLEAGTDPTVVAGWISDAKLRSRFYEEAGVLGTHLPDSRSVDIDADPCVGMGRVGGGT